MAVTICNDGIGDDQNARKVVFFDVETTVPFRTGQKHELLEFGAIVLDVQGLSEVHSYETLIRPSDLSGISRRSVDCNGISKENVAQAPTFAEVADEIYRILNGRIWAGHNIEKFDMLRIREAFSEIQRQAPEPAGIIDTYPLLKKTFGPRAGNLRLATLANFCGYGKQKHRSLDDVRMNLDVLRSCATMLFLESNYPNIFSASSGNDTCTSTIKHSTAVIVSQEQVRRSRNDFLPDEDCPPPRLSESVRAGLVCDSTGPRQGTKENTRVSHVSFRMEKGGPSVVSESITASALNSSIIDPDRVEKNACSGLEPLKDGSSPDDTQKVYRLFRKMDLANIKMASIEETKNGGSEVVSAYKGGHSLLSQKTEGNGRLQKDDTIPIETENTEFEPGITKEEVDGNFGLSAALLQLSLSDMTDAHDADPCNITGIEAQGSSAVVQMCDSDLRIAAKECFLLSSHVFLDSIELMDESSPFVSKKALYHQNIPLQLWECEARIRFTINPTYAFDDKGRPRFSILLEPSEQACEVISKCEDLIRSNMPAHGGEEATWLPLIKNERGISGVRMRIETTGFGGSATYITKFFQLTTNGIRGVALGKVDVAKFRCFLPHGSVIDVGFGFGVFNINGRAGLRLLAKHITLR